MLKKNKEGKIDQTVKTPEELSEEQRLQALVALNPEDIMPKVDLYKVAREIKEFIGKKKMDLIDYGIYKIECYPPPDNEEKYPETAKFSKQWDQFFDWASAIIYVNNVDFPEYKVKLFEDATQKVVDIINADTDYWDLLRIDVIPLYEKSPQFDMWKNRWKSIGKLFYYPEDLPVTTTQIYTIKDAKTGKVKRRIRGKVVRENVYRRGLVVNIN